MKEHEEYVRSKWPRHVDYCGTPNLPVRIFAGDEPMYFKDWDAARAFTLERENQICQVEAEIDIAMFCIADLKPTHGPAAKRILARLQAVLADLRRGMA